MNNKLKKMYDDGGLISALLKDPKQRAMAEKIIQKAGGGMSVKRYRNGGSNPEIDKELRRRLAENVRQIGEDAEGGIGATMARETQKRKIRQRGELDPSYKITEDYVDVNEYIRRRGVPPEAEQIIKEAQVLFDQGKEYAFKDKVRETENAIRRAAWKEFNAPAGYGNTEREYASGMESDGDMDWYLTYAEKYKDAPFNIENFPGGGVSLMHPTMGMQYYKSQGYEDGGKAKTYRSGGMMYQNGGETDPPYEVYDDLVETTVIADKPSGYKSTLFKKKGVSEDDYSRERYNLGREIADKIMGSASASPVSNKVVSALLGEQVDLSGLEKKELGYLRKKNFDSGLLDLQLQRGLLESGYIDKKTGSRLTEEAIEAARKRGLKLTPDQGGLNATYFFQ